MDSQNKIHRKVILLGEPTVGKSSIINRRIFHVFNQNIENTIGTAYFKQKFSRGEKTLEVSIWDTCGQEQYMAISTIYYHETHVIILVIDSSMSDTLDFAKVYMEEIEQNADEKCTVLLCVNKIDLLLDPNLDGEQMVFSYISSEQQNCRAMQALQDHCDFYNGII